MSPTIKVFEPLGTLNRLQGKQLYQDINASIKDQVNLVLIDMKDVTDMDSAGLAALALIQKTIQATEGKLFLASISEPVKMLLELTSLDSVFEIFANRHEFNMNIRGVLDLPDDALTTIC